METPSTISVRIISWSTAHSPATTQDEGSTQIDFSGLIEPFIRGQNAAHRQGIGLGQTIVDSIAASHGGAISFSRCPTGTIAEFLICR